MVLCKWSVFNWELTLAFRFLRARTHVSLKTKTNFNLTRTVMTITKGVTSEMFEQGTTNEAQLIRMDQRFSGSNSRSSQIASTIGWWTTDEHEKFLEAVALYPSGPWKKIARHIGSRTPRQVMTHAQKYRQRIKRRSNRKTRSKTKDASSKVTDPLVTKPMEVDASTNDISKADGGEKPALWETLLLHEVAVLEPLPLLQMPSQLTEEVTAIDLLLLNELQQLIAPATDDVLLEPVNLDGDELMELLVDPATDWAIMGSSSQRSAQES